MKNLKHIKLFESYNGKFSIYDFDNYLRDNLWAKDRNIGPELIGHVEHFFGLGEWKKIENHFAKVFDVLDNVDLDYINDRLLDVFDEYPQFRYKYAMRIVLYGDIERYDKSNSNRYNGSLGYQIGNGEKTSNSKNFVIVSFLRDVLRKTSYVSTLGDTQRVRHTNDELYVPTDKWSIKNLPNLEFDLPEIGWRVNNFLDIQKNYSIERFLDMYRPGIYITITDDDIGGKRINSDKINAQMADILPSILHDLDYEEVLHDNFFSQKNVELTDFTKKILLKMP